MNENILSENERRKIIEKMGETVYEIFKEEFRDAIELVFVNNKINLNELIYILLEFLLSFNFSSLRLLVAIINSSTNEQKYHKEMISKFLVDLKLRLEDLIPEKTN